MKLPSNINDQEIFKDQKTSNNRSKSIIKGVGLLVGLLLIILFVKESDPAMIWIQLKKINFNFVFLMGVSFLAYLLVSIAWKQCFLKQIQTQHLLGECIITHQTLLLVLFKLQQIPPQQTL